MSFTPVQGTKADKNSKTKSPTEDVSTEALAAGGTVTQGTGTGAKTGLTGVPVGTPVRTGEGFKVPFLGPVPTYQVTRYAAGDGFKAFTQLDNEQKIDLLRKLAQIPGLYATGKAPTAALLSGMAVTKMISARPEDIAAIEKVMFYSDSIGEDYSTSVNKFYDNPKLAQNIFDIKGAGTKVSVTPSEALYAEIDSKFQDFFTTKVDKDTAASYTKTIQAIETRRKSGLTAQEKQDILLKYVQDKASVIFASATKEPGSLLMQPGALGQSFRDIKAAYENNGIPVNDKMLYKDSLNAIRSPQAYANVIDGINMQASVIFPAIKDFILQGKKARDVLSPYISTYSRVFGIPEDQVNMSEMYDVASGDKLVSLKDYNSGLYKKPGYKLTDDYKNKTTSDVQSLLRSLQIG